MRYLAAFLMFLPDLALANPYFRPFNVYHPQVVTGALIDPSNLKQTSGTGLVPLVTHSPNDGCLFPSVVCEDWTPLAVGASLAAGRFTFDAGPLANVLPWVQRAAVAVTPEKWSPLIHVLTPAQDQSVTFSAGPVWEYQQVTNKGYLKVFTGLALHF